MHGPIIPVGHFEGTVYKLIEVTLLLVVLAALVLLILMCAFGFIALKKSIAGTAIEAGRAYVLSKDVTVGTIGPDGGETHCVMPRGDVIRVDEVRPAPNFGRAMLLSYGRTSPHTLGDLPRCHAGLQARFDEDSVRAMIE